jgi:addiction module HigA family antidote
MSIKSKRNRVRCHASRCPTHPGASIRELALAPINVKLSRKEIAKRLGVTLYALNKVWKEQGPVTAEFALRLGRFLKTTPESWLNMQRSYDLWQGERRLYTELKRIRVLRRSEIRKST